MIKHLVCLLEEPSAKEMLEGILPRFLDDGITVKYIVFDGKQDLEKNIEKRLKFWKQSNSGFLVMRDKDSGDCIVIKNNLIDKIEKSGQIENSVIRIACHELESFYLGDLSAVEKGLKINGLARLQSKSKFREPDKLSNPSEELYKLTKNKYQKVAGSRAIAPHLKIDRTNKSYSFNMLLQGIKKLIDDKS